jgi:hypothetical protein
MFYIGSLKQIKMDVKSSYSTELADKVVLSSFNKSELSSVVVEQPKYMSIKNEK